MTAAALIQALHAAHTPDADSARFYAGDSPWNRILGVRIPDVLRIAKGFPALTLDQIEAVLEDPHYEVRMAAMTIMDLQARRRDPERHGDLHALYLRCHDRIDNWDLVDRAAPTVIGAWLLDRGIATLERLAADPAPWPRRTAIVATFAFLRRGDTGPTFAIAGRLAADPHPYVQKAVGSWLREAGKRDPDALSAFAAAHDLPAATRKTALSRLA